MPDENKIELPFDVTGPLETSPKRLIIFSKPKTGKTEVISKLKNCLILDLEDGSDYVAGLKIKAHSVEEIKMIGEEIKKKGKPYDYIAVDTITALEDMCIPFAELIYSNTSQGQNWFTSKDGGKAKYGSIINLPNGGGYQFLRTAMTRMLDYISTLAPRVIFLGHVKDVLLEKNGSEFNSLELDLTGRIKRIVCSQSDAIGYLYRKGDQNILSFKTSDEVSCGARPKHLSNREFVISESNKESNEGGILTYWDRIYID